jgi:hypothetical protein
MALISLTLGVLLNVAATIGASESSEHSVVSQTVLTLAIQRMPLQRELYSSDNI